jgi:thiol-disulfide isomerase/thioredoxin
MTATATDKTTRNRRIAIALAAVAVIAIGMAQFIGSGSDDEASGSVLNVNYTDSSGQVVSLTQYGGRPLVVNFFASWCGPCIAEMPDFEDVSQAVQDDVQIIGIAFRDTMSDASAIIDETGVTYPWGLDEADGQSSDVFVAIAPDSIAMPTTVFISPEGEVLQVQQGPLTADGLMAAIEKHFGDV